MTNEIHSIFTLDDCINNAIKYNPTVRASIYNDEAYKTLIGQAWANYFPTFSAGVSYSRNDMMMTMGGAMAKMIPQKYNLYYVPNLSANMLLFDFGKTKAVADSAKRYYESTRYDAETAIERQTITATRIAKIFLVISSAPP